MLSFWILPQTNLVWVVIFNLLDPSSAAVATKAAANLAAFMMQRGILQLMHVRLHSVTHAPCAVAVAAGGNDADLGKTSFRQNKQIYAVNIFLLGTYATVWVSAAKTK
jgi:hypothetical protein